jgi:hypothetical protein
MIANHETHSTTYEEKDMELFLERASNFPSYVKRDGSSSKIVSLGDIVYIEGTLVVAF